MNLHIVPLADTPYGRRSTIWERWFGRRVYRPDLERENADLANALLEAQWLLDQRDLDVVRLQRETDQLRTDNRLLRQEIGIRVVQPCS